MLSASGRSKPGLVAYANPSPLELLVSGAGDSNTLSRMNFSNESEVLAAAWADDAARNQPGAVDSMPNTRLHNHRLAVSLLMQLSP